MAYKLAKKRLLQNGALYYTKTKLLFSFLRAETESYMVHICCLIESEKPSFFKALKNPPLLTEKISFPNLSLCVTKAVLPYSLSKKGYVSVINLLSSFDNGNIILNELNEKNGKKLSSYDTNPIFTPYLLPVALPRLKKETGQNFSESGIYWEEDLDLLRLILRGVCDSTKFITLCTKNIREASKACDEILESRGILARICPPRDFKNHFDLTILTKNCDISHVKNKGVILNLANLSLPFWGPNVICDFKYDISYIDHAFSSLPKKKIFQRLILHDQAFLKHVKITGFRRS